MIIKAKVKTNAKNEKIVEKEDYWEISVKEPPIEGKANKRIIELLAKHLKIPKSRIEIKKGSKSKLKIIEIKEN
jgi:uncharacterized protein (TIGR00251 family)